MMPDWNALVREHLDGLSLEAEERREVIAELAAHLEESFEELRRQGLAEEAAVSRTLLQLIARAAPVARSFSRRFFLLCRFLHQSWWSSLSA
jgi:hypothetical protein